MNRKITTTVVAAISMAVLLPLSASAQMTLTLEDCRQMALSGNNPLQQAATKVEMAHYDKQTARANYYPKISALGGYMYNGADVALVGDDFSTKLQGSGSAIQTLLQGKISELSTQVMTTPALAQEFMTSPMWQTVMKTLSQTDLSQAIGQIGSEVDDLLHPDLHNLAIGVVSLQQPVFYGGKIVAANKIATLAEELARSQYATEYQQIIVDVDQAYWQIVSVAAKKELAENFVDLLHTMEHDITASAEAGVATQSDVLQVKVKSNEAEMMLCKATNGLTLAKMLLCKQIGLPLDTEITLADEGTKQMAEPIIPEHKPLEQIYEDRAELRSLDLATQIYDNKVTVARSDMLPKVALMANYYVTNPSVTNGFQNKWAGSYNAGVMLTIPIFHGCEALSKTRKAKAEATLYRLQRDNARDMVSLEVNQLYNQQSESLERLRMAQSNLESAEENLRMATIGFEAGTVDSNTALGAQTAWLQAHSEYIDAGIELQMTGASIRKAEGYQVPQIDNTK